jgi:hypothetical protein
MAVCDTVLAEASQKTTTSASTTDGARAKRKAQEDALSSYALRMDYGAKQICSGALGLAIKNFKDWDRNSDGFLSQSELEQAAKALGNAIKKINRELPRNEGFKKWDLNNDGSLSQEEIGKAGETLKRALEKINSGIGNDPGKTSDKAEEKINFFTLGQMQVCDTLSFLSKGGPILDGFAGSTEQKSAGSDSRGISIKDLKAANSWAEQTNSRWIIGIPENDKRYKLGQLALTMIHAPAVSLLMPEAKPESCLFAWPGQ